MAFKIKRFISPLHAEGDPKDSSKKSSKVATEKKKSKKTSKFPGYDNIPNAKPYKRNSDGSVNMITDKGSTYSLRRGVDK